jgi:hypothetical protein
VLVRLAEVSVADLRQLLTDAWRCQAPAELAGTVRRKGGVGRKP